MSEERPKLTKADIRHVNLRYMYSSQLGWNYERMMNLAYAHAIYPAMNKLYGDDPEALKDMMRMEMQFFNTSPVLLPTIMGSLAAYMGLKGNPVGAILWLLVACAIVILRLFEMPFAFKQGKKIVGSMGNMLQNLTESASLLGVLVIGGLIPSVVKVVVPFKLVIGKKTMAIQTEVLDQILPALVPIALVALAYWMLGRKHMNSSRVIWIFLILSIIFYSLKILGVPTA